MNENNSMFMPVAPAYNGGGFGADFGGGWWLILLVLLMGGGMWGGGGFGGNAANTYPWLNQTDTINTGFQNQMLNSQLTGVNGGLGDLQTALCSGFAGVNSNINNGFSQSEIANNARQMADMNQVFALQTAMGQGFSGLQAQLAQCCCDNRLATCQTQNAILSEAATTRAAIQSGVQNVLDMMCQDKIDSKNEKIVELQNQLNMSNLSASQYAQTQQILAAIPKTAAA